MPPSRSTRSRETEQADARAGQQRGAADRAAVDDLDAHAGRRGRRLTVTTVAAPRACLCTFVRPSRTTRWAVRASASGSSPTSRRSSAGTPAAWDAATTRAMSSRPRRRGQVAAVGRGAGTQHAEHLAEVLHRLARRRADELGARRDLLGRRCGLHLERAGVHGDQRHLVGEHVVHLAGDARPLGEPGLLGPHLLLGLGPRRPLAQRGDEVAAGADVRAGGDAEPDDEHAGDDEAPRQPSSVSTDHADRERRDRQQRRSPARTRSRRRTASENSPTHATTGSPVTANDGEPDQRHGDRVPPPPPQRERADDRGDADRRPARAHGSSRGATIVSANAAGERRAATKTTSQARGPIALPRGRQPGLHRADTRSGAAGADTRRRSIDRRRDHRPSSAFGVDRGPMPGTGAVRVTVGAMIHVDHLVKRYGDHVAVDDVSFTCRPGTVTGFLGPNGAGKSTTLRMMTGLTPPTAGRATIDGRAVRRPPEPGPRRRRDARRLRPAPRPHRASRRCASPPGCSASRARRADEMLERSASAAPGASASATTRSACASASASAPPCSATRPCWSSTNRPTGWTPRGSAGCACCCATSPRGGGTALLSSHLLGEVQATVDRLVVIGNGRIVADDDLHVLLAGQGTTVRGARPRALARRAASGPASPTERRADGTLRAAATVEHVGRVAAADGPRDPRAARRPPASRTCTSGSPRPADPVDHTTHPPHKEPPMTTTTVAHPSLPSTSRRSGRCASRPLLAVELRKLTDTRSGRGLLAATLVAGDRRPRLEGHATPASRRRSTTTARGVATMVAFLTPLIGLLAMTSEWTQRTALTTFTLAPRRLPVLAAKYVAALALSLAVRRRRPGDGRRGDGHRRRALHGPASFDGWPGDVRYAVIFVAAAGHDGRRVRRPGRQHAGRPQRVPARADAVGDARRERPAVVGRRGSTSSRPTAGCRRTTRWPTSARR